MVKDIKKVTEEFFLRSNPEDAQTIEEVISLLQLKDLSIGRASAILDDVKEVLYRSVIV